MHARPTPRLPDARLLAPVIAAAVLAANAWAGVAAAQGAPPPGGIWKAAVPGKAMHGEFDGYDPVGIAVGAKIKADCSLNWIDPDDGARYCFSSGTSLEYFLDRPQTNIRRARAGWRRLNAATTRP
jgi:hypothetical protein